MTAWRISVQHHDDTVHDLVVDATEEATVTEFWTELADRGFDQRGLLIDGQRVDGETSLERSPLRHGSCISTRQPTAGPGAGWYLVAVAGPDTGAWVAIDSEWTSIGRNKSNSLRVRDRALSAVHFRVRARDGKVTIEDRGSTNGTVLEGVAVDGETLASDSSYIAAGTTTFGVIHVARDDISPSSAKIGATSPFQRRFRDALEPLPRTLQHPAPPQEKSDASRRPLVAFFIPILSAVGMAFITGRIWFLAIIALGPIFYGIDNVRRRKIQDREKEEERAEYEAKLERFKSDLGRARRAERDRDRWSAAPAGIAALLTRVGHTRLWERSADDDDFCEVAIGLYSCSSDVEVEGNSDDLPLELDTHWSAVLRHSLVKQGPVAVLGDMERARALARAMLLDLATSHSPNDVKLWLVTDSDKDVSQEWNDLRWLPHTYISDSQNSLFATPTSRAAAFSMLRSIINERRAAEERGGFSLPVFVVVMDCVDAIETEELTDLLVDGAEVGVVGVVLDERVTPEGTRAQLTLGTLADVASFVSESQPRADKVRNFEMPVSRFAASARSLASLRPAGSSREQGGGPEVIRLVELIDAETDAAGADRVIERWARGGATRIRVGGLGDLITEVDIMRDGPHGLVGGTTRSGKTEFLKSLITSLAVSNYPDDLSIVIVDFKGGVDHELSALLPHVIDLSTNHNVDSFVRTVRLIEAELQRRQHELKGVGAPNFDAYRAARRADPSLRPIPRLLVIIDEFSELLSSETGKANLSSLESVTRVGGGLGVHLLLVTQNFENQLPSQIAANAGLRICFRVQEDSHSKAVLNSPEAATIPKERIGRAFLRSHGGRVTEFQAARVAGPRPGKEVVSAAVQARIVPFPTVADAPPESPIVDVPAEDTDMYAIVDVINTAAARSGWTAPAVPWPKDLRRDLSIGDFGKVQEVWPVGLLDEPERQQQSPIGLEAYGPHTFFVGGAAARMGEVLRAVVVSGAMRRSPEELHFYVIDELGQGLSSLQALPHVGGVAERNEPLALRILRHVVAEVGKRKTRLSDMGMANVRELHSSVDDKMPDIVLVVHGADRLLMHGEAQPSPLLAPLMGLLSESVGTGVRVMLTGPSSAAHHRIGTSIGHRFVLECADSQEYSALGVPRPLQRALDGPGRAVDVSSEHLMQFALVPSSAEASATEVIRALGQRLAERWPPTEDSQRLPLAVRELPWPLPVRQVISSRPTGGVQQPVALCVDTETSELSWLDAEEDGPAFVVCGSAKSGRSNALLAAATLMAKSGWSVLGLPLSRRSPVANGDFPGPLVTSDSLDSHADSSKPVALFIDDAHKWAGEVDGIRALLEGPGHRAVILAGPTEYFSSRNDLLRILPARCALVLAPKSGLDASQFGVRRLGDEVLRDTRPGRGVLVVSGELNGAQVPLAVRTEP